MNFENGGRPENMIVGFNQLPNHTHVSEMMINRKGFCGISLYMHGIACLESSRVSSRESESSVRFKLSCAFNFFESQSQDCFSEKDDLKKRLSCSYYFVCGYLLLVILPLDRYVM